MIWQCIDHAGSIASICGTLLTLYLLVRGRRMANEVHVLKAEEEKWHEQR